MKNFILNQIYQKNFLKLFFVLVFNFTCLSSSFSASPSHYSADNTGKNKRDRGNQTLTPQNQPNNEKDLALTREARKHLQKDDQLSMNAKNVKIITINGKITLRGPVNSEAEKTMVADHIKQIVGAENVVNQLEVAP